jgi:spore coat protein A
MHASRRTLLKLGGLGVLGAAGLTVPLGQSVQSKSASRLARQNFPVPYRAVFARPPVLTPTASYVNGNGEPVKEYTVTERAGLAGIVPGLLTPVYGYNGSVPGPTIDVERGTRVRLRVRNKLPATHPSHGHVFHTSVHLHGSPSLPEYDGYADDVTLPGQYKDYYYDDDEPARTLWYHDHGVHVTAQNAYSGLAAQYHLHDPVERALLPQGEFDVPITLSDAMFAADGTLSYDDRTHSGLWGDVILVNGRPWPAMRVKRRVYRFRVLNASISRAYRPSLSTGDPVTMVATDGGLMPVARPVTSWRHGNAERYEILIDFSRYAAGTRVLLRNLALANNIAYDHTNKIMAFDVVDDPVDTTDPTWNRLPTVLTGSATMDLRPAQAVRTRGFRLARDPNTNEWTINGKTWHDVIDSGYTLLQADPDLDDIEIWEVENKGGGWFHPLHIHLVDFQILSRNGRPPFDYERGPKDVVYVGENEKVRLLMQFEHHRGRYMMHCHNLPHEDHDMMAQFSVGLRDFDNDPHDPRLAALPQLDTLPPDA